MFSGCLFLAQALRMRDGSLPSDDWLRWALATVQSRHFPVPTAEHPLRQSATVFVGVAPEPTELVLIPLADMFNHHDINGEVRSGL
jgi:hypothetical protein